MIILFLLIISQAKAADSFLKGCLAKESNLNQACTMLKKVKSTDTLVFATGETMKGCFLMTKNPAEVVNRDKFNRLSFLVHQLLKEKVQSNPSELLFFLKNPQKLLATDLIRMFTESEKELIQIYISSFPLDLKTMTTNKIDFKKEFESSQRLLLGLLRGKISDPEASSSLASVISSVRHNNDPSSSPDSLSCKPNTNAFFAPDSRQVRFQGGTSQYPLVSRINNLGHEMAHSIDLKWYSKYVGATQHPLMGLITCLREGSGQFKQDKSVEKAEEGARFTNEAFCDHFGAELVAEHLKFNPPKYPFKSAPVPVPSDQVFLPPGYEIIFFELDDYCSRPQKESKSHPSAAKRIKEIYLRNPTIAKALNCPTNQQECDLNGTVRQNNSASPKLAKPSKKAVEDPLQGQK